MKALALAAMTLGLFLGSIIHGAIANAGTVAEDIIALAANGSTLGLYSRQLEVDIEQAKLNIEKEFASKIQSLMDQAKSNRMKSLSTKLVELEAKKLTIEALKSKTTESFGMIRQITQISRDMLARDLVAADNLILLREAIEAQGGAVANLAELLTLNQNEQVACRGNSQCEWIILNQAASNRAKELGISLQELISLSALASSQDQLSAVANSAGVADEIIRNAKQALNVKYQTVLVEITATRRALEELAK